MKDSLFRDYDNGNKYVKAPYQGALAKIGHLEYLYDYLKENSLSDWAVEKEGYEVGEVVFDTNGLYRNTLDGNITQPSVNSPSNGWTLLSDISTPYVPPIAPYKVYTALLTQTGNSAPVATELQNDFDGTITYSYTNTGTYTVTSSDSEFTLNKTTIKFGDVLTTGNDWCSVFVDANSLAEDEFIIYNQDLSASSVNTVMKNTMIEIRVYN